MVVGFGVEYLTKVKRCRYNTLATVVAFNTMLSNLVFGSYLLGVHETVQKTFCFLRLVVIISMVELGLN